MESGAQNFLFWWSNFGKLGRRSAIPADAPITRPEESEVDRVLRLSSAWL